MDEAAQVQFLDSLVVTLKIDDKICSNYSKLVPSSGHVSDGMDMSGWPRLMRKGFRQNKFRFTPVPVHTGSELKPVRTGMCLTM